MGQFIFSDSEHQRKSNMAITIAIAVCKWSLILTVTVNGPLQRNLYGPIHSKKLRVTATLLHNKWVSLSTLELFTLNSGIHQRKQSRTQTEVKQAFLRTLMFYDHLSFKNKQFSPSPAFQRTIYFFSTMTNDQFNFSWEKQPPHRLTSVRNNNDEEENLFLVTVNQPHHT